MSNTFGKILNFLLTVVALGFAAYALKPLIGSYLPSMTSWGTPKPILVASISFDHGQNELRAKEKYGNGTFDVTGIASDFEMDKIDGNVLNIIMGDGSRRIALYAKISGGRVGQVAQINKGNLITVTCKDYGIYGITPSFSECKNPRLYPLNGKSADLVYDQLLAANNPYLNASPSAAKAPSAPPPTKQTNLSTEESYLKLREELLTSEWTSWTQPPINKWKAPFSEVMICDEGVCKAFFIRSTDQNNLRGISYAECGSYEKYADTEAAKKICSGKQTGFLVVLADKLISMKDGVDFYKSAKARFE